MKKAATTSADPATRRSAVFGLAEHVWDAGKARWLLRLRKRRLAGLFVALGAVAYLGVAGVKYAENKWVRDCPSTSFGEMCLFVFPDPIPMTKIHWAPEFIMRPVEAARASQRAKLSDVLLTRAKRELQDKEWGKFFPDVFVATKLDPKNREARSLAAQAMFALRRDDDGLEALELSLPELIANHDFVKEFIVTCLAKEQDSRLVGVAKHHLANPALTPEVREAFTTALAGARYHRGEFDACLEELKTPILARSRDAFLLRVNILKETGKPVEAVRLLESAAGANPNDTDLIVQLIALRKDTGDTDGARSTASLYLIRAANLFHARLKLMDLLDPVVDRSRVDDMVAGYRRDFAGNADAALMLCEFAANAGLSDLCESLLKEALVAKSPEAPRFRLLFIESHLAARHYEETVRLVDEIFIENPSWLPRYRLIFDALRMVAHYALGREDTGEIGYRRVSESQEGLPPRLLETVARRLLQAGRNEEAVRVVNLCLERNRQSLAAMASLITIHLESGGTPETPARLREYLRFRRPTRKTLLDARRVLGGDAYLFEPDRDALVRDIETLLEGKPLVSDVPAKAPKEAT